MTLKETTLREMISVMEAAAVGEPIQRRSRVDDDSNAGGWNRVEDPTWDWYSYDYRVKPADPLPGRIVLDGVTYFVTITLPPSTGGPNAPVSVVVPMGNSGQYASKEAVREVFQTVLRNRHCCGCTKKAVRDGFKKLFDEEL